MNALLTNIIAMEMLIVQTPLDPLHVLARMVLLEMELVVQVG